MCLFMDNLGVHKGATEKMKELGFKHVFNVVYSPEFNPIELTFSKLKGKFKKLRAQKLVGLIQDSHEALITRAWRSVNKKDVVNCIRHVEELLA